MCVLKPAVYQKAKSHWLHLFHFPPCVLSNASSKLLHLRIHNYALQRFHSVTGLTIEIKTGLIFALGSNCNQFKYTPQVLKRLQLLLGRGDFEKKSQKVPAFWNMAAVTVIRLSGYIGIPSCTALYCRRRNLGGENAKRIWLTHLHKIWFCLVPYGSVTT